MSQFTAVPAMNESAFVRHLVQTVLRLGVHGNCVIIGRGAAQVLPPGSTLRVRLVAPRNQRIATVSRRQGISLDDAAQQRRPPR